MFMTTYRPRLFDSLQFAAGQCDEDGRRADRAPCGCTIHRRTVLGGPLAGHWYGDVRCEVCASHANYCDTCERLLWPYNDCVCDVAETSHHYGDY